MPGSTPATSQLDWLISTTAMIVLSWSKATRDLLKSFGWGIRALHQLVAATMVPSPRRLPHTISPLEREGFEPSVPREEEPARRDGFCSTLPALPFREKPRRSRPALHGIATPKDKHPAPWQLAGCEARRIWVFTVWIRSTRKI